MPQEIITQRLALLSPEYVEIFGSGYTNVTANIFGKSLRLNINGIQVLENGISLFLLLYLDSAGLTHFLITECGIEPNLASRTVTDITGGLPPSMLIAQVEAYKKLQDIDNSELPPINTSTRVQVLKSLPRNKVYFYQYIHMNSVVTKFISKYNFLAEDMKSDILLSLLGDIILGFYKIEDTVPLLQQELGIDAKTAALLGVDVLDFLAPLSDPNFIAPAEPDDTEDVEIYTDSLKAVETPYQPEYFQVADPAPTPSITTDAILKFNAARAQLLAETSAPEMRTMASDMARSSEQTGYEPMTTVDEPTYTSQQPEVRTPLSGLPAYTNAHTPTAAPTPAIHEPARWS